MAYGFKRASLAFVFCMVGLGACSDDTAPPAAFDASPKDSAAPDTVPASDASDASPAIDAADIDAAPATDGGDTDAAPTLYEKLGEVAGIQTKLTAFVGVVVQDARINGYF